MLPNSIALLAFVYFPLEEKGNRRLTTPAPALPCGDSQAITKFLLLHFLRISIDYHLLTASQL